MTRFSGARLLTPAEVKIQLPHRTKFYKSWVRDRPPKKLPRITYIPFFEDTLIRALLGRNAVKLDKDVAMALANESRSVRGLATDFYGLYHHGDVRAFGVLDISVHDDTVTVSVDGSVHPGGDVYTWITRPDGGHSW